MNRGSLLLHPSVTRLALFLGLISVILFVKIKSREGRVKKIVERAQLLLGPPFFLFFGNFLYRS